MFSVDFSNSKVPRTALGAYAARVKDMYAALCRGELGMCGWINIPLLSESLPVEDILKAARKIKDSGSALVVVGIGGSYLGARAALEMLKSDPRAGVEVLFAGWNLSASYHRDLIRHLEGKDFCVCAVSKSGETMETSIAFRLLKEKLKERCGENYTARIYAVTDETSGELRREAEEKKYTSFPLDKNIGGRYSVLTAAGLLPLAAGGADIEKILSGALSAYHACGNMNFNENFCFQYAALRRIYDTQDRKVEAFICSDPRMAYFSEWLKQLFGESEGKQGKGIFPTSGVFSTDLHSLGQFMQDGSPVLFETIIHCREDGLKNGELAYMRHCNNIVVESALAAHAQAGTPVLRFDFNAYDERSLGYMIYFFEMACAVSCMLLGVNPFDQPAVEVYKSEVRKRME